MSKLLVIGCGGVASVAIRKCCQNSDVFTEIMIASRTTIGSRASILFGRRTAFFSLLIF